MFLLFKIIKWIIVFIVKAFIYAVFLIYKSIILILKSIKFIFTNKVLRVPALIILFGILFKISFVTLCTIYFIYLLHISALKLGVYANIFNNIKNFALRLKEDYSIKKLLKLLPADDIILSNISLEGDTGTLNINHMAITPSGLYNIIPLSMLIDNDCSIGSSSKLVYDIYNKTENIKNILSEIIDEEIPITNLVVSSANTFQPEINNDNFILVDENQLLFIINSSSIHNSSLSSENIDDLKTIIIENKSWLLDNIFSKFIKLVKHNRNTFLFLILCPLIYIIYINALIIISNLLTSAYIDLTAFMLQLFKSI